MTDHAKYLRHLYYDQNFKWGAQKIYQRAKQERPAITQAEVREWLRGQKAAQITRPTTRAARALDIRPIITKAPLNIVAIDLKDMGPEAVRQNRYFRYIMFAIDLFSRCAWFEPMKHRETDDIQRAFNGILRQIRNQTDEFRVRAILADNEFKDTFRQFLKTKDIKLINTIPGVPTGNSIAERFNNTWTLYLQKVHIDRPGDSLRWLKFLGPFVDSYNNNKHEAFLGRYTPLEVLKDDDVRDDANEEDALKRAKGSAPSSSPAVGDRVRLILPKSDKINGKTRKTYTDEVFIVDRVTRPNLNKGYPLRVRVKDAKGEPVRGELTALAVLKV